MLLLAALARVRRVPSMVFQKRLQGYRLSEVPHSQAAGVLQTLVARVWSLSSGFVFEVAFVALSLFHVSSNQFDVGVQLSLSAVVCAVFAASAGAASSLYLGIHR
jgi:hypothetical protein